MFAAASEAALLRADGFFVVAEVSDNSTSPCSTSSGEEDGASPSSSRRALLCSSSPSLSLPDADADDPSGKYFFQYDEARKVTMALKRRTAPKMKL